MRASLKERYKKVDEVVTRKPGSSTLHCGCRKTIRVLLRLHGPPFLEREEGIVVIEQKGDTVLVSESLDPGTTSALEGEVFGVPAK